MRTAARWLRHLADRLDYRGAPRSVGWSFTFEHRRGIVFRDDGKGCSLWYLGDAEFQRAHDEADTDHVIVDWTNGRVHIPDQGVEH